MNSNGILHFRVDHNGRLTLWDTPQQAMDGKERHEVVVQIPLTKSQMSLVLRAEGLARSKKAESNGRFSTMESNLKPE